MGKEPCRVIVAGSSGSGKTTLIERLLPILTARGVEVGTIKHAHKGFELDRPGKDSWRHMSAGARVTALIGPAQSAWLARTETELDAPEAAAKMADCVELILVEGFKRSSGARIELGCEGVQPVAISEGLARVTIDPADLGDDSLNALADFCLDAANLGSR